MTTTTKDRLPPRTTSSSGQTETSRHTFEARLDQDGLLLRLPGKACVKAEADYQRKRRQAKKAATTTAEG